VERPLGAIGRPSRVKSICLNRATRFTIQTSKSGSCAKLMGSGRSCPLSDDRSSELTANSAPENKASLCLVIAPDR
jgi:hypothetical protein